MTATGAYRKSKKLNLWILISNAPFKAFYNILCLPGGAKTMEDQWNNHNNSNNIASRCQKNLEILTSQTMPTKHIGFIKFSAEPSLKEIQQNHQWHGSFEATHGQTKDIFQPKTAMRMVGSNDKWLDTLKPSGGPRHSLVAMKTYIFF